MALYEFQPPHIGEDPRVSRIQVFKGATSPIIEESTVYIPRNIVFPREPFYNLRRESPYNVHQSVNRALMATILEIVHVTSDQIQVWLDQNARWLENAFKTGEEKFQLHIEEKLNNEVMKQAPYFDLSPNTFILYSTAPIQRFT